MARLFTLHGSTAPRDQTTHLRSTPPSDFDPDCWIERMAAPASGISGKSTSNSKIAAGYTYFGQFLAHDITYFKNLGPYIPPRLDLHVLYGLGPEKSAFLYEFSHPYRSKLSHFDRAKLRIWKNRNTDESNSILQYDVPRLNNQMPVMGDARNDENFIISQLHVKFIQFHNFCAEVIYQNSDKEWKGLELFHKTHQVVKLYYHLVIIKDYLPKHISPSIIKDLILKDHTFKLFDPIENPLKLSREFSEAAFRMGHSQVRNQYNLTKNLKNVPLFRKRASDRIDLTGFNRDERRDIDWELFFHFQASSGKKVQSSRQIDLGVAKRLQNLPFADSSSKNLIAINIHKSLGISVENNQFLQKLGGDYNSEKLNKEFPNIFTECSEHTELYQLPLWIFVLLEARVEENGEKLGQIGERLIAEQIIWILKESASFDIIKKLFNGIDNVFKITDLLKPQSENVKANIITLLNSIHHV